jgi:hypothetical protein
MCSEDGATQTQSGSLELYGGGGAPRSRSSAAGSCSSNDDGGPAAAPAAAAAPPQLLAGFSFGSPAAPAGAAVAASAPAVAEGTGGGDDDGSSKAAEAEAEGEPALARELGVTVASLDRLFCAGRRHEFEQPVWMVVNLQVGGRGRAAGGRFRYGSPLQQSRHHPTAGWRPSQKPPTPWPPTSHLIHPLCTHHHHQGKIKGSYAAEKMLEFVRRGTLSARQQVLGIDRDLSYVLRQELGFYRALGDLAAEVHSGGRYVPLSAANAFAAASPWVPIAPGGGGAAEEEGEDGEGGEGSGLAPDGRLRQALRQLFTPGEDDEGCGAGAEGAEAGAGDEASAAGEPRTMWLYVNHLLWCRG